MESRSRRGNPSTLSQRCRSNQFNSGPITFLGGMLLVIGSILEFILGNTFPCVFFGTIGRFGTIDRMRSRPLFSGTDPAQVRSGSPLRRR